MKRIALLLTVLFLGAGIGWALGYLRLPHVEQDDSFWLGFFTCMALVAAGLIIVNVLTKRSRSHPGSQSHHVSQFNLWLIFIVLVGSGGLLSKFLISQQQDVSEERIRYERKRALRQTALIESVRNHSRMVLMKNVLDQVNDELIESPDRKLSQETIARITALSQGFIPYQALEGDSLSAKSHSPERGQLLLSLINMNIHPVSLQKIISKTQFSYADLRESDLRNTDLRNARLRGANLQDTDLAGADLGGADLRDANLWGAILKGANLIAIEAKRASLRWADMQKAVLDSANFTMADLSNAKLNNARIIGTHIRWADLSGAILQDADLTGAQLTGTRMKRTNFIEANLETANLTLATLEDANLSNAILHRAPVFEEEWLDKLNEWRVTGAEGIQNNYRVIEDLSAPANWRLINDSLNIDH